MLISYRFRSERPADGFFDYRYVPGMVPAAVNLLPKVLLPAFLPVRNRDQRRRSIFSVTTRWPFDTPFEQGGPCFTQNIGLFDVA